MGAVQNSAIVSDWILTKRLIMNGTETRKALRAFAKYTSPEMKPIATVEATKTPTELLSGRYCPYIALVVPVVTWGIRRGLSHGIFPVLAKSAQSFSYLQPTSVSSKNAFRTAWNIVTKKLSSIELYLLGALVFSSPSMWMLANSTTWTKRCDF